MLLFLFPVSCLADTGHSTVVMDVISGRVLYSKNSSSKQLIASTTKLMTCIIVLENSKLEDTISVGEEVLSMYGTNIYIEVGEKLTVKDLLYGLILRSGNDAALTLAVHTLGEDAFVRKMNEKAIELGMKNTSFENPHGLDENTKNYSTAYDMALLSSYAYQNSIYRDIISTKKYVTKSNYKSYIWYNRMSLLNRYEYCIGGKNGYTPKAGKSLVSYAKKGNTILTIVSLDDPSIYENHRELYEKYFSIYRSYSIIDPHSFMMESTFTSDELFLKDTFQYPLSKEELENVATLVELFPKTVDSKAGVITIFLHNKRIGQVPIFIRENEKKKEKSFFQCIIDWIF